MRVRLGIRGRLFALLLAAIAITALVIDAYVSSTLRAGIEERMVADLRARASLVAHEVEAAPGEADRQALAQALGRRALARVTLIARDGAVLGDSDVEASELGSLENHGHRPEVVEALGSGTGAAARASATVHHGLLYVALRTEGGAVAVVRLSESLAPIETSVARSRELLLIGTAIAIGVAGLLASLGAHLTARPLRALRHAADRMFVDVRARTRVHGSDEVGALGEALDRLADDLSGSLDRLRSERDRLEAILETMAEGVLVTGGDRRIVLVNSSLRTMLGVTGAVVGKAPLEAIRSHELDEVLARVADIQAPASVEIDGFGAVARRVRVRAAPLATNGEAGVVAVLSDVTDLRRLETIRRDFVANVSHELRTPIAAIRAAAETLESGALDDPGAAPEFLGIIARHGERLHRLVEDLLDLSRIEAQKVDLAREPVPVAELLDRLVELYRPAAERHGVTLARGACEPGLTAVADRRALEQVVSNLVDNAIKYAPGASVTLSAAATEGAEAQIAIADTGPGIAPQHLPRLFERFYRVDPGRSRAVGGTGLGLSIAKHLTEAMRGRISAESTPGRGATFVVRVPAAGR